ncbi:glycoside hydrolase family 3 protein [Desarmillaria tabescens]|uniref:beta-glucosidase n=1 Tax=Armillaria tabescens TaxID=1929756 RepID=A0AA39T556_ARMTA|nr:glycoside hydrolase family 3 protein [Desarmillaria tabescens]KAK0465356.1 glycoside hydrolase family 3 protein [Desarmillaria tabescens]
MARLRLFVTLAFSSLVTLVASQQQVFQQCGGNQWTEPTNCHGSGSSCIVLNDDYYQCLSTAASTSAASSTSTSIPKATNMSPEWQAAYTKAKASVAKLSLEEKVDLATGVGWMNGNCVGNTPAIPSISFPGLCLEDSPLGVRFADNVSAFPAAINAAATFNRTLIGQRGVAMGQEFRGKGVHVALGPMMNTMRAPAAGRNWEGFGGDPYLSGEGAYETIMGLQSVGVQATAKHYINNEQEHFRETSSSDQHEIYAHPFLRAIQANVAAVMCSYINGSFACENDKTLNGILKTEFGFPGYWQATHSTGSINLGLDMTMPGDTFFGSGISYFGPALVSAVNQGTVPEARIDDMATRILAAWYLLGQDSGYPDVNFDAWDKTTPVNTHVDVQSDHKNVIRAIGQASTVLLKNSRGVLPLKAPHTLAIIGSGARNGTLGPNGYSDRGGDDGVLAMGWGSGTADFPYLIAPLDALTAKASADGTKVSSSTSDTDLNAAANAAAGKDVAIVFITADSGEGYITVEGNFGDRNDLLAWHGGDALVQSVASVNPNTIVAVNSVGPITMENWIENENVTAVVWSGLPGQEAGNAVTDVLYGVYNPSGRLPYTIARSAGDYSAAVIYSSSSPILDIPYNEGLFVDYRHFDAQGIKPRFEFGFGLSYTTFEYSHLRISGTTAGNIPTGPGSSLDPSLHESVVKVGFTIRNVGKVTGHEIPQLYISLPPSANSPPQGLKGFDSIYLKPGESTRVTMELSRYSFAIWDVKAQKWVIPSGTSKISIGSSSRNIRLTGTLVL